MWSPFTLHPRFYGFNGSSKQMFQLLRRRLKIFMNVILFFSLLLITINNSKKKKPRSVLEQNMRVIIAEGRGACNTNSH
ncbi:hypothetical protein CICLE_v10023154mg [Citrus x clementina]|uniref:Transmembrane protein n=1 Tax=Citrus clementina TaxID=85681 RepID=V4TTU4_CITCL|nr:hypothetical protein CICLE_v10023154mg [Citrus x clementina]